MITTIIVLSVLVCVLCAGIIVIIRKKNDVIDNLTRTNCSQFEKYYSDSIALKQELKKLESTASAYQNLKSHIHAITVEMPKKKSSMYVAMKLSGKLGDFISYDYNNKRCSLIVLNTEPVE